MPTLVWKAPKLFWNLEGEQANLRLAKKVTISKKSTIFPFLEWNQDRSVCLFVTEATLMCHGGLRTRELGQSPMNVSTGYD